MSGSGARGIIKVIGLGCAVMGVSLSGLANRAQSEEPGSPAGQALSGQEQARLTQLSATSLVHYACPDLDEYLRLRSRARPAALPPGEKVIESAGMADRQPYRLSAARFDFTEGDCVTFTERALAMGLSRNWEEFYALSERLRHRDGEVAYENRNFCTLSDWVPNNAWLLRDITPELTGGGRPVVKYFPLKVREPLFEYHQPPDSKFTRIIFKGYDYGSPPRAVLDIPYVPRNKVPAIVPQLETGDVCLVIREYRRPRLKPWLDCDHLGLIVRDSDGTVSILHSAPPSARQEEITEFLRKYRAVAGFRFLRVRADAELAVQSELRRLAPAVPVPAPEEQDEKNAKLRTERGVR